MTTILKDSTSHSLFFELVDSSTGLPKTGILYSGVTTSYVRAGAARTAITPATLASASASWSSGGFILIDDTNQPGVYRFDVPNAAFATGVEEVVVTVKATGCRTQSRLFRLEAVPANVTHLLNTAWLAPETAGTPDVKLVATGLDAIAQSATGMVEIAKAVWDRVLSGATHNINNSAGRRLRQLDATSILAGTAAAGASNSITLDGSASATNDIYDENLVVITDGTGVGQTRVIVEYNGSTKVAIVNRVWQTNPSTDSAYEVIAGAQADIVQHGLAQGGTASTITLSSVASASDDIYIGSQIYISTSDGTGQTRLITDYNGTTKAATVSPDWLVNPTSASVYKIIPVGRSIVDSMSTSAIASIWNALTSGMSTAGSIGKRIVDYLTGDIFARLGAPAGASIAADIAAIDTGSGTGAYTITLTVNDGATALQNATIRMTEGVNTFTATTNASGIAVFGLDAATYSVAITKDGYEFTPTTRVVSATASGTYSMAAITLTPSAAGQTTCYLDLRLLSPATVVVGTTVYLRLDAFASGSTGLGITGRVVSDDSDADGRVEFPGIPRLARCAVKIGDAVLGEDPEWFVFTTADAATTNMISAFGLAAQA